jgi:hypothetical protein
MSPHAMAQEYSDNESWKLGIKTGAIFGSISGGALENARMKYGFSGGIYYKHKVSTWGHIMVEGNGSFRGSNYNNKANELYRIGTFYIETPVVLMVNTKQNSDKVTVFAGGQFSVLANATSYVDPKPTPEREAPSLQPVDYFAVAGVQLNNYYTGIQLALKWGLSDINNNITFPNFGPEVKSGNMRNFGVELSFYF